MSKPRKLGGSTHTFRSYLGPFKSANVECSSPLPVHLCHISSVESDVIHATKENMFSKCRSQRLGSEPLAELNRAPLADTKKQNKKCEENLDVCGENPLFCATPNHRLYVSDEEAAPASAWYTLGNRALLLKPLPVDVGRCRCYIVREHRNGPSVYSLCTDEGKGRQDRLLAVARHIRRLGRSEFVIAQNRMGTVVQTPEEGYLGTLSANLVGTRYHLWEQGDFLSSEQKFLQAVVTFEPTVTTLTGDFRRIKAYIANSQIQTNGSGCQFGLGLTKDWEENMEQVKELVSKTPRYNRLIRRYELDFHDDLKIDSKIKIKTSVKNFQLTMEDRGKEIVLLLGKLGKSTYVMEYRYPLTGFQAFGICLASLDSKLCCTV